LGTPVFALLAELKSDIVRAKHVAAVITFIRTSQLGIAALFSAHREVQRSRSEWQLGALFKRGNSPTPGPTLEDMLGRSYSARK